MRKFFMFLGIVVLIIIFFIGGWYFYHQKYLPWKIKKAIKESEKFFKKKKLNILGYDFVKIAEGKQKELFGGNDDYYSVDFSVGGKIRETAISFYLCSRTNYKALLVFREGGLSPRKGFFSVGKFCRDKNRFVFPEKKIKLPTSGPGSAWKTGRFYLFDSYDEVLVVNNLTRTIDCWGVSGDYIDTYLLNGSDISFLLATNFFILKNKNRLFLIPQLGFYSAYYSGRNYKRFKPNNKIKQFLKKPAFFAYDIKHEEINEVVIKGYEENGKGKYGAGLFDNNGEGYIYVPAAYPHLLFTDKEFNVVYEMRLENLYDKWNMSHVYKEYDVEMVWGNIVDLGKYLLIVTPCYHYGIPNYNAYDIISQKFFKSVNKMRGDKSKNNSALFILIDKKRRRVIKSGIYNINMNLSDGNYRIFRGEYSVSLHILGEMEYLLYLVEEETDYLKNRSKRYYLYKRLSEFP